MIECVIVGDSIAQGIKQYRPECVLQARRGISSHHYNKHWPQAVVATSVVISLGSNDGDNIRTLWELMQLRGRVTAQQVYWILPANNPAIQDMIRVLARDYDDVVLGFEPHRDKTHPTQTGYRQLAESTK
jgi:lysophospholipase L1-like esterase